MKNKNTLNEAMNYTIVPKEVDSKNRSVEQQISDLKGKVNNDDGDSVEVDEKNFEGKVYTKKEMIETRINNIMKRGKVYTKGQLLKEDVGDEDSEYIKFFQKTFEPRFIRTDAVRKEKARLQYGGTPDEDGNRPLGGFDDVGKLEDMIKNPHPNKDGTWWHNFVTVLNMLVKMGVVPEEHNKTLIRIYDLIKYNKENPNAARKADAFMKDPEVRERLNSDDSYVQRPAHNALSNKAKDIRPQRVNSALVMGVQEFMKNGFISNASKESIDDVINEFAKDNREKIDNQRSTFDSSRYYLYLYALITNNDDYAYLAFSNAYKFGLVANEVIEIVGKPDFPSQSYITLINDIQKNSFKQDYNKFIPAITKSYKQGHTVGENKLQSLISKLINENKHSDVNKTINLNKLVEEINQKLK